MSGEQTTPEQLRVATEQLLGAPADEFRQGLLVLCDALREDDFTRTASYRGRTTLRRTWFRDDDGTYYRNCPLIYAEQGRLSSFLLPWRFRALEREWWHVYREGVLRTRTIGRFDRVATPGRLRDAYPDNPGLWALDEERP